MKPFAVKRGTIVRRLVMKHLFFFLVLLSTGCFASSYQFTYYRPAENEPAWRIKVEKKAFDDTFICTINGSLVVIGDFAIFKKSFTKDGIYRGRIVTMSGYSKSYCVVESDGGTAQNTAYHIRIFIDETEAAIFDF
jgi:hypothetical protein